MLKLFLDDVRSIPESDFLLFRPKTDMGMFYHLAKHADLISFDHDFGDDVSFNGYDVICRLEEQVHKSYIWHEGAPELIVHSDNPAGRARMEQAIQSIYNRVGMKST